MQISVQIVLNWNWPTGTELGNIIKTLLCGAINLVIVAGSSGIINNDLLEMLIMNLEHDDNPKIVETEFVKKVNEMHLNL